MKKKIILRSIVIMLIILNSFVIYLLAKPNSKEILENVKTMNIFDNKDKTLSIMLQEDGINFTEAKDRDAWPDITKYTYDKAECTDSTGAVVDYKTILTFNYDSTTPTVTVKTKNTVYCTLYFVKGRDTLNLLKQQNTFQEKSGMWRFVGTNAQVLNNYICFGTTDPTVCKTEPDKYMYRIIGMTKDADTDLGLDANRLKLIKATPSNQSQAWNTDYRSDVPWESSDVYKYLNNTFLTSAKSTQWQTGTYWDSLITSQKWYIQDQTSNPTTEPTGKVTSGQSKIGLMYATDYMNASSASTSNWLHLRNGWSGNSTSLYEWTMSRYGDNYGDYNAWFVRYNGSFFYDSVYSSFAVRPVFYLKSNVMLTGSGTTSDPFRIAG